MKIKVAFGNWEEAEKQPYVTPIALTEEDKHSFLNESYADAVEEHRREYGDVHELWLHVPDDVIARLFSVRTINPAVEEEQSK